MRDTRIEKRRVQEDLSYFVAGPPIENVQSRCLQNFCANICVERVVGDSLVTRSARNRKETYGLQNVTRPNGTRPPWKGALAHPFSMLLSANCARKSSARQPAQELSLAAPVFYGGRRKSRKTFSVNRATTCLKLIVQNHRMPKHCLSR